MAVMLLAVAVASAQEALTARSPDTPQPSPMDVLQPQQQRDVEASVDRALAWLATQQQRDGSFLAPDGGQPGITALCIMAFLSRGHLPGQGPYGTHLDKAVDFVLSCQKPNGLICKLTPGPVYSSAGQHDPTHSGLYNHSISGLMLCEVFGMTEAERAQRIRRAVDKAINTALTYQKQRKPNPNDRGGWRYARPCGKAESDLSVTSWHLLFLRAAKNSGFEVPTESVEEALAYVKRCWSPGSKTFLYTIPNEGYIKRAQAGMGVLSLSMAGEHDSPMAQQAGQWILQHPFTSYNRGGEWDRYHYGVFYCTHAMFQLGGTYWQKFFPPLVKTLLANQGRDGSWQPEALGRNDLFGNAYTTSLVVMSLTAPYQLLPIFQR
ncbi:MAG: terpene cyclase/mutase family protein [Planctomycetes bacterium]|nr:terpene cyclase/mutase family protein [Planctomycetota bacterium]